MPGSTVRSIGLLLFFAALPLPHATAQSDPRLVAAVRNAQEGQSDSARTAVQQLLAATPPTDTLYPQILYTAGLIANEAADMQRQLQRIAVEFPVSSWADDALLRLAQLDYATRQLEGAARHLERMAIDFPTTSLFAQAAYWAGRTYFDLKKDTDACRWLADGIARAGEDVELQTQLGYLYQRCDVAPTPASTARADSLRPDSVTSKPAPATPPPPATPPKPATATAQFRVQIAAVGTSTAAEAAARKAQALGYRTVTVQEGGLYKVRAGEFPTRAEAQQASTTLKAKLGGSPFVVSDR